MRLRPSVGLSQTRHGLTTFTIFGTLVLLAVAAHDLEQYGFASLADRYFLVNVTLQLLHTYVNGICFPLSPAPAVVS